MGELEWATIVAAAIGAAIGFLGEYTGRRGARKQAEPARDQAIEAAERLRIASMEDERQRVSDQRARLAADRILRAFAENPVHFRDPDGEDLKSKVTQLVVLLYAEHVHLTNRALRIQILETEHIFDAAFSGAKFEGYTLSHLVYLGRVNCFRSLGAWLRNEEVPEPTEDWKKVLNHADKAIADLSEQVQTEGMQGRISRDPLDY